MPAFARAFGVTDHDEVRFSSLKPLVAGSAWSAIAVICPRQPGASGGIVGQRHAGSNAFTLALRDGVIAAESGALVRLSKLAPPVNDWSRVGIACGVNGTRFYLGTGGSVTVEDGLGLPANTCGTEAPIVIGRAGGNFAGSIAVVCLFAEQLPDAAMQAMVRGALEPCFAPKLVFAWLADGTGNVEIVSRRAAVVTGTRVVPVVPPALLAPSRTMQRERAMPNVQREPPAPAEILEVPRPRPSNAPHSSLFHELGLDDD